MEAKRHNELQYYRFSELGDVTHGIFTRHGGVSAFPWLSLNVGSTVGDPLENVRENAKRMYAALEMDRKHACTTWQVHGNDVLVVDNPLKGRSWIAKADGMITNRPGVPLVMRYADCVPLVFHDPVQKVIGIAHAGWRGTVKRIASATIEKMMTTCHSSPEDIRVGIGPSISQKNFQVGNEVVGQFATVFGNVDGLVVYDPADGTAYIDLWLANRLDLESVGVTHIEVAGICTYDSTDKFYSHRAEKGKTGRFGAVISL